MNSFPPRVPRARDVSFSEEDMTVALEDGRVLSVPLEWFPRLRDASTEARKNWRLVGKGTGIYWEDIDENLSVAGLLVSKTLTSLGVASQRLAHSPQCSNCGEC